MPKGYKVVSYLRSQRGMVEKKLFSYIIGSIHDKGHGKVYYEEGVWTVPNEGCGPLCVCDTIQNATRLSVLYVCVEFWECDYEESDDNNAWVGKYILCPKSKLIPGTVLAKRVKLLRKLGKEELETLFKLQ